MKLIIWKGGKLIFRIGLCDDSDEDLVVLKGMIKAILKPYKIPVKIDVFKDAEMLVQGYHKQSTSWDLIILDILLGKENGVNVGGDLREVGYRGAIIYASSSEHFALPAIETDVLRYLVKPLDEEKLKEALLLAYRHVEDRKTVSLAVGAQIWNFDRNDIYYLEAYRRGTLIHFKEEQVHLNIPFFKVAKQLEQGEFNKSHFSFLVNMKKITHIKRYTITFDNGHEVPVSKSCYKSLQELFMAQLVQKF